MGLVETRVLAVEETLREQAIMTSTRRGCEDAAQSYSIDVLLNFANKIWVKKNVGECSSFERHLCGSLIPSAAAKSGFVAAAAAPSSSCRILS